MTDAPSTTPPPPPPPPATTPPPPAERQRTRRLKYGLNVAIAAAAALALVILLNWLVATQIRHVPPDLRPWVRYDLTATRQYSLSRQTINVLKELDQPYRIVALLPNVDPDLQPRAAQQISRARDLLDEYARYSPRLTVERGTPEAEADLTRTLRERYAERLAPVTAAIETGRAAMERVFQAIEAQRPALDELAGNPELTDAQVKRELELAVQLYARVESQREQFTELINAAMEEPLPDYGRVLSTLRQQVNELNEGLIVPMLDQLRRLSNRQDAAGSVKDQALRLQDALRATRADLEAAIGQMRSAAVSEDYSELRRQLNEGAVIVILGPTQERVVALSEMFRRPAEADAETAEPGEEVDLAFLGEEVLTGALATLELRHRPLVVFLHGGRSPPLGRRGEYEHVAQRLRKLNFQVEQWSPMPQQGPMGQMVPPGDPPRPAEGQRAVWILPPLAGADPGNPMAAQASDQVLRVLRERMAEGDAALIVASLNPAASVGADPLTQMLEPWGIRPQSDRLVLREVTLDGRSLPTTYIAVERWPRDLAITQAITGRGMLTMAIPLELAPPPESGVRVWPLIVARGNDLWAEDDLAALGSPDALTRVSRDAASASDAYVVGAASESQSGRLVVLGDAMWATDLLTTNADPGLRAPGLADRYGAAYPGNAELFINSVYWLAGLDHLIAASARSQDVRRIAQIEPTTLRALQWTTILGMPAVILVAGIAVWLVRRRG